MSLPTVTFVLHHPDALRVLGRALENAHRFYSVAAADAERAAAACLDLKQARAAQQAERRAVEFARRRDLTQQLRDQLPTTDDAAPLPAPSGE